MTKSSFQRHGPRIDLRLRVRWSAEAGAITGEAEASDVSPRGLRLESDHEVKQGSDLTIVIDAGDEENLEAIGKVMWCKPRSSPTGRTMFDLGVAFENDWLAQKRGPLGTALARIFAMNSVEPARGFERTPVSLHAATAGEEAYGLEIADLSLGGMQLRAPEGKLNEKMKTGSAVIVEVEVSGKTYSVDGTVVWVAGQQGDPAPMTPRVGDAFGVKFAEMSEVERGVLDKVRLGQSVPTQISVVVQG
jgi:Tfp pilus assembly protein PilZ